MLTPGLVEALWADESVKVALALCNKSGSFLFQVRPDLFPYGRLTDLETELWARFLKEQESRK